MFKGIFLNILGPNQHLTIQLNIVLGIKHTFRYLNITQKMN